MQDHAADQLDVEVAHAEGAPGGLAHQREHLDEVRVERLLDERAALLVLRRQLGQARPDVVPDGGRPRAQRVVRKRLDFRFLRVDLGHARGEALDLPLVLGPDEQLDDLVDDPGHTHLETETVRLTVRKLKPEQSKVVVAPHGQSLSFNIDDVVFVPVRTAMRVFNRTSLFRILVDVRIRGELGLAKRDVEVLMRERHRADDVTFIIQGALLSAFSSILSALTLALVGIASVSLAVAGVGIMNVMLVSVTERRAEIGLLKALGALDRQVLAAFLAEALLLALARGVAGVAVGAAAIRVFVGIYPSFPASPPAWAVAAALDPVEALREE